MINKKVPLDQIRYETKETGNLLLSIRERGVAIPVQVDEEENGYVCIDGHKRLSACALLAEEDSKFAMIPVMIRNNYTKAGSGFWGNTRNKH